MGSIIFSLAAFLNHYLLAIFLTVGLAILTESIRIQRFSFIPHDFFNTNTSMAGKFHHASLLCLSLGLLIAGLVMLNNQYLHFINKPNLVLDDFFLGFSFPISLLTFSVMFSLAKTDDERRILLLKEANFWIINLGVIIFFIFIVLGISILQVFIAVLLFLDVLLVLFLVRHIKEI